MAGFWHDARFSTWEIFKFMILFYIVWVPGFLLVGLLSCRFRYRARESVLANPGRGLAEIFRAVAAGMFGSVGRKERIGAVDDLLSRNVSPTLGFAFLIASRNMTIHFWAIFALSLGAEFATGQILGALVMIGIVTVSLRCLKLKALEAPSREKLQGVESVEHRDQYPGARCYFRLTVGWPSSSSLGKRFDDLLRRFPWGSCWGGLSWLLACAVGG